MTTRRATCSCGQLSATCDGEPQRVSICHCLECQRRTGSVFGAQARFLRAQVTIAGAASQYRRTGDSGNEITFHFCPRCGGTVAWFLGGFPDIVAVAIGGFGDPAFPSPRVSVYERRKHDWVSVPAQFEHLD